MDLFENAKKINLVISDVDGVLTNGTIYFSEGGKTWKGFNSLDGQGITLLLKQNIQFAIISGRHDQSTNERMNNLGVTHVYQDQKNKIAAYEELLSKLSLTDEQVAMIGDDLPDLPLIKRCGLGIAVPNGADFVKQHADWCTTRAGGAGAVRDVCELIFQAKGIYTEVCHGFL